MSLGNPELNSLDRQVGFFSSFGIGKFSCLFHRRKCEKIVTIGMLDLLFLSNVLSLVGFWLI